jgi:ribosome-associated protein
MSKKTSFFVVAEDGVPDDEGGSDRVSYRERSEQANAIAELALLLVGMKPAQLAAMPLSPELAGAVEQCQAFRKNARARQLRLIAKLLRQVDHEELRRAVTQVVQRKGARSKREKVYETWRERLLTEGDPALGEFLECHRDADAQRLRQLVRVAGRDPASGKGKHAARELFRMIRDLGEAAAASCEADDEVHNEADARPDEGQGEAQGDSPASDSTVEEE